jgi:hypothetical protein
LSKDAYPNGALIEIEAPFDSLRAKVVLIAHFFLSQLDLHLAKSRPDQ